MEILVMVHKAAKERGNNRGKQMKTTEYQDQCINDFNPAIPLGKKIP